MLVSYSDSEDSGDEQLAQKPKTAPVSVPSVSNFAIDKSTGKIKVNLQSKPETSSDSGHEDAPAAKRPRLGQNGGAFSGFNAMLPAPKQQNLLTTQNRDNKAPARKVFSLRTGAEPAFNRESDAELRELFAEHNVHNSDGDVDGMAAIPPSIPKPAFAKPAPPAPAGRPMLFKPLSVARNNKKKKSASSSNTLSPSSTGAGVMANPVPVQPGAKETSDTPLPPPEKKKINLFSSGIDLTPSLPVTATYEDDNDDEIIEDLGPLTAEEDLNAFAAQDYKDGMNGGGQQPSQTLSSIASDLNLSAAERRQLFGRGAANTSSLTGVNIVNFNTDAEYAANQQLIATGEKVQHNPVRAIVSGKHSLQQLLNSAATQKEALEESFAAGRRNRKEAGNKYGW